jgi:hypothetical protein
MHTMDFMQTDIGQTLGVDVGPGSDPSGKSGIWGLNASGMKIYTYLGMKVLYEKKNTDPKGTNKGK